MGRNVDLSELGLSGVECPVCKNNLDNNFDEIDLDCDVKSNQSNQFKIFTTCSNCDKEIEVIIDMQITIKRRY
jgi:hypothetical protein